MILVERNLRKFFVITYWQQRNQAGDLVSNIDVIHSLKSSKGDQSQKKSSKIFYNNDMYTNILATTKPSWRFGVKY